MFKRRPYLHYSAGLLCVGLAFFAASIFVAAQSILLAGIGTLFLLLALGAVLYHDLT